jgi:octaprenyl-diphosphate synthase
LTTNSSTAAGKHEPLRLPAAYDPVRPELIRVAEMIAAQVKHDDEPVGPVMRHITTSRGSMIRPALVLLSGKCFGQLSVSHVRIGAIVEMIHSASLLHDDVLDQAQLRRGRTTTNGLWGNDCAVLAGDCLLARAFSISGELQSVQISRTLADATQSMCRGELRQNLLRGHWDINEETYGKILEDKTGRFFKACCILGGIASRVGSSTLQNLGGFGLNVGMAFQHTDDLLDIIGDEATSGKEQNSDLANRKTTLAFIRLLAGLDARRKAAMLKKLGTRGQSAAALRPSLTQAGALKYVFDVAAAHVERAVKCLRPLSDSHAKAALLEIARSITARIDPGRLE